MQLLRPRKKKLLFFVCIFPHGGSYMYSGGECLGIYFLIHQIRNRSLAETSHKLICNFGFTIFYRNYQAEISLNSDHKNTDQCRQLLFAENRAKHANFNKRKIFYPYFCLTISSKPLHSIQSSRYFVSFISTNNRLIKYILFDAKQPTITLNDDDAMIQIERSIKLFNKTPWIQLCTQTSWRHALKTRCDTSVLLVQCIHIHTVNQSTVIWRFE